MKHEENKIQNTQSYKDQIKNIRKKSKNQNELLMKQHGPNIKR